MKVIDELRQIYKLCVLLKIAGVPKSTYEYHKTNKYIKRQEIKKQKDKQIYDKIYDIYKDNFGRYGYIRITLELRKSMLINQKKVERIMHEYGLKGIQGSNQKYHSYKGDNGLYKENLLLYKEVDTVNHITRFKRNFTATKPNEKWTTDVSEFKINAGKLYLSPILDMYSDDIISYDISTSPNFAQTKRMLDIAFNKYQNLDGLTFHSDQGWQYQMVYYQKELLSRGIKQSFSRKGNCMDNSPMENFFGIMKNEMFYGYEKEFKSLEDLQDAMIKYINYYNNLRINKKRKGLSPIEYREQYYSSKEKSVVQL